MSFATSILAWLHRVVTSFHNRLAAVEANHGIATPALEIHPDVAAAVAEHAEPAPVAAPVQPASVTFDPAAYPDAGSRIAALQALGAELHAKWGNFITKILSPNGFEFSQQGEEIKPYDTDRSGVRDLGSNFNGSIATGVVAKEQVIEFDAGPYRAGAMRVGTVENPGGAGTALSIDVVDSSGAVVSHAEGAFKAEAYATFTAIEGARYKVRVTGKSDAPTGFVIGTYGG